MAPEAEAPSNGAPPPVLRHHEQRFRQATRNLPPDVFVYLRAENRVDPWHITDMASQSVENCIDPRTGRNVNTIMLAEVNFARGISRQVESCTQGSPDWAAVLELYRAATNYNEAQGPQPSNRDEEPECEDPLQKHPGKEAQEDLRKAEYMTIKGEYRLAAIRELNGLWRHKVPKTSLPSYRLWGMILRQKWLYAEYQPIDFWQLQNAENGKIMQPQSGERAHLREDARGSGWHLPPISVPTPGNQGHLEEALTVLHNTIVLAGWVQDPTVVLEWHHKFWSRARKLTAPQRNNAMPHTLADIIQAHLKFQRRWAAWSETHEYLDETIRASLPDEEDLVDARMSLTPKFASTPHKGKGTRERDNHKGAWNRKGGAGKDKGKVRSKGKGKENALLVSMADRLANATGKSRNEILCQKGAKGSWKGGKGKNAKGSWKGGKKGAKEQKGAKGKGVVPVCMDFLNGTCTRGESCRFRYEE